MKIKSFTIIELLVVLSIIALLASIIIVSVKDAREKARIAKIMEFAQSVQSLLGIEARGIWNFDEKTSGICTGSVSDISGYNSDGSCQGGPQYQKSEIYPSGGILKFDGNDDYISVPHNSSINFSKSDPFSVFAWIRREGTGSYDLITAKLDSTFNFGWHFDFDTENKLRIALGDQYGVRISQESIKEYTKPEWLHVGFTYDGSNNVAGLKLYVNGEKIESTFADEFVPSNSLSGDITTTSPLTIGGVWGLGGVWGTYIGKIEEVRIYKDSLSSLEIQKIYVEEIKRRINN